MTTADKTKQKLVDSMRKSKSGAASKPSAGTARATTTRKTSARRTPAKPAAQRRRASTTAALMLAVTRQVSDDSYQSDGRIWPD
jgi:hypothetical protein